MSLATAPYRTVRHRHASVEPDSARGTHALSVRGMNPIDRVQLWCKQNTDHLIVPMKPRRLASVWISRLPRPEPYLLHEPVEVLEPVELDDHPPLLSGPIRLDAHLRAEVLAELTLEVRQARAAVIIA